MNCHQNYLVIIATIILVIRHYFIYVTFYDEFGEFIMEKNGKTSEWSHEVVVTCRIECKHFSPGGKYCLFDR